MKEAQQSKCAICEEVPDFDRDDDDAAHALAVDHNHETGEVRELLCRFCNTALGYLRERPDLALKAADYLTKHSK